MKNQHGGDTYSRDISLDFSANINPLGMPQSVKTALVNHIEDFQHYPDINSEKLRNAVAAREKIRPGQIVFGNGAADLIYRIVQAIKPKNAVVTAPTFSEYERAMISFGCNVSHHFLSEKNNFDFDDTILEKLHDIDMIFLCSPNNPTGRMIGWELMNGIIQKCRENHIYLVLDECFMDFAAEKENYSMRPDENHVIILKAFTKIYAMAGLRLGYALCGNEALIRKISDCGQCWSVSVPAQIAGIAALGEADFIAKTVRLISAECRFLSDHLRKMGFTVYPSEANFILFKCGFPLDEMLLEERIAIRNCGNYIGLGEGYFRIAVRTHEENITLVNAIERIVKNGEIHHDSGNHVERGQKSFCGGSVSDF